MRFWLGPYAREQPTSSATAAPHTARSGWLRWVKRFTPRYVTTDSARRRKAKRHTAAASPVSPSASITSLAANLRRNHCPEVGSVYTLVCLFRTVLTRPPDRYRGPESYAKMSGHDHRALWAEDLDCLGRREFVRRIDVALNLQAHRKEQNMSELSEMRCTACRGDEPTLTDAEIGEMRPQVPEWQVVEREGIKRLERVFRFSNFAQALAFTNRVGERAEEEGHHPALLTEWGKVTVTWWTHKIGGLHQNDFIMAARTDELSEGRT